MVDTPAVWVNWRKTAARVKYLNGFFTTNGIFPDDTYDADALKQDFGPLPDRKTLQATRKVSWCASCCGHGTPWRRKRSGSKKLHQAFGAMTAA